MTDEQKRLTRDLGALADRLTREPVFGPDAKEGDEVVLDDGTRVVLAEDPDPASCNIRAILRAGADQEAAGVTAGPHGRSGRPGTVCNHPGGGTMNMKHIGIATTSTPASRRRRTPIAAFLLAVPLLAA